MAIAFSIALAACIILGISLVYMIYKYQKINESIKSLDTYVNSLNTPTMEIDSRLKYTQDLFSFIDNLITMELINQKRFDIFLGQKGKNIDIDGTIEKIATIVFESFDKNVFTNPNNIMTEKYLMAYIQKKTTIACFNYINNGINVQ